jgi:predicted metal-dependent hydrolase
MMSLRINSISDPELGTILLRANARARRFTFRPSGGHIVVTVPPGATTADLSTSIERLRPRLRQMLQREEQRAESRLVTPTWRIEADDFRFWSEEADVGSLRLRGEEHQLVCYYPAGEDFSNSSKQQWLVASIEEHLRRAARATLLPRIRQLALQRGLAPQRLGIHKTKSRWGSCSARGHIALSLYLLLLPRHLQNLVMHHELTHLTQMNHSPRFHALLNEALGGHEKEYEAQLRRYDTSIFTLDTAR